MKLRNLFLNEDWRKRVSDPADIAALQIIVSKINSVIKSNGSFKPFKMELNQLGYGAVFGDDATLSKCIDLIKKKNTNIIKYIVGTWNNSSDEDKNIMKNNIIRTLSEYESMWKK